MSYGSTEVPATAFAITTVNVPDRLDLRDMDDRKLEEDTRRRFDLPAFRTWAPRLFFIALFAGLAFILLEVFDTWRTSLSAQQLSQRLTSSVGVPVEIESSRFAFSPVPRLVLTKVSLDHKLTLGEVSVNVGTRHIAQVLQGHGWNWGEAVVGPTLLTLEQGNLLIHLLPKLGSALPNSLSALRFDRVEIAEQPWLSGQWQLEVSREGTSGFAKVMARTHSGTSWMRFVLTPGTDEQGVHFQMDSQNWRMPFGASFPMEEAIATGEISPTSLEIREFSLGGPFGAVKGNVKAAFDGLWSLSGVLEADGLDLAALVRLLSPPPANADAANPEAEAAMQGNAAFSGKFEGKGGTLVEAASSAVFAAPLQVRWPVLNGINLGYAATRPGASAGTGGGSTRFSALSAVVVASGGNVSFRDLRGHAGALAVSGDVNMAADHTLNGVLHVELGATRVLAPIRVAVRGTVSKPVFGR